MSLHPFLSGLEVVPADEDALALGQRHAAGHERVLRRAVDVRALRRGKRRRDVSILFSRGKNCFEIMDVIPLADTVELRHNDGTWICNLVREMSLVLVSFSGKFEIYL